MEDGVADGQVFVAAAAIDHFERIGGTGADHLAVAISADAAFRRVQPLMRMLVVNMRDVGSGMQDAEPHMIAQIAVIDIRRIVGIERLRRRSSWRLRLLNDIYRLIHDHGGITVRP